MSEKSLLIEISKQTNKQTKKDFDVSGVDMLYFKRYFFPEKERTFKRVLSVLVKSQTRKK